MTGKQIVEQFNLDYGQDISLDVFGLEDSEVLLFLNQAVDDLVHEYYRNRNLEPLSNLLERGTGFVGISNVTGIINSKTFGASSINDDFLYYVKSQAKISKSFPKVTDEWTENDLVSVIESAFAQSPYHKPMFQKPKVMKTQVSSKLAFLVIYDSHTTDVNDFILEYIRRPAKIVNTNDEYELDASLHPIIIKHAVTLAIEVMQAERVKTQPQIDK